MLVVSIPVTMPLLSRFGPWHTYLQILFLVPFTYLQVWTLEPYLYVLALAVLAETFYLSASILLWYYLPGSRFQASGITNTPLSLE